MSNPGDGLREAAVLINESVEDVADLIDDEERTERVRRWLYGVARLIWATGLVVDIHDGRDPEEALHVEVHALLDRLREAKEADADE